jgi:hypothetical protein
VVGETVDLRVGLEYTCCGGGSVGCSCNWTRLHTDNISSSQPGTGINGGVTFQVTDPDGQQLHTGKADASGEVGDVFSGTMELVVAGTHILAVTWHVEISQLGMCVANSQPHVHSMFDAASPCRITVPVSTILTFEATALPEPPAPLLPPPPPPRQPPPSASPPICTGGREWNQCGSACTPSCEDLNPVCILMCVARCQCPFGEVEHAGSCVPSTTCPPQAPLPWPPVAPLPGAPAGTPGLAPPMPPSPTLAVVSLSLVVAGSLELYPESVRAALREAIAANLGVEPACVEVSIAAGSVIIAIEIRLPTVVDAEAAAAALAAPFANSTAANKFLASADVPIIVEQLVGPPSVSRLDPQGSELRSSHRDDRPHVIAAASGASAAVLLLCCVLAVAPRGHFTCCRKFAHFASPDDSPRSPRMVVTATSSPSRSTACTHKIQSESVVPSLVGSPLHEIELDDGPPEMTACGGESSAQRSTRTKEWSIRV